MNPDSRIYVAGHAGLVGSAIARRLRLAGYRNILGRSRREMDLEDQVAVRRFFRVERPEYVFLAAAKVGGILANNTYPADFIRSNLAIQSNVIQGALEAQVSKLLFLGSSCIYPRLSPQPIKEEYLLSGALEPTNEPYAIAKIAGIIMCQSYNRQHGTHFGSVMPTNLYGPGDNFDLETSHVLPALMRKMHEAKMNGAAAVTVWGSGRPRREFLHVDDMADACVFVMERDLDPNQILNVGCGEDISIGELASLVREVVGFEGEIIYDSSKPDGTPRKLLDVSRLRALGWTPNVALRDGVAQTYRWFLSGRQQSAYAAPGLSALTSA